MSALAGADYKRAVQFFETNTVSGTSNWYVLSGSELAQRFQKVLDRAGSVITPAELSNDPSGKVNDGLPEDVERFGVVNSPTDEVPLLAKRVKRDGKLLWLVSEKTLNRIPSLDRALERGSWTGKLIDLIPEGPSVGGAPISHWLTLFVVACLSFVLSWVLTALRRPLERVIRRNGVENKMSRFIEATARPVRVLIMLVLFGIAVQALEISVVARYWVLFLTQIVGWFALAWLLWRCTDAASEVILGRMSQRGELTAYSVVSFSNRAIKAFLGILFVVALLRAFGVNVTAGLAALGVGGLAIALGAQKLLENLIGSLTVIADNPVRIGDFCRFGSALGTVEEIGIRSTRIRTLDRTILTVPNGEFASLHIENYSQRDRFWFHPVLNLRYETSTDQMRHVLQALRSMLGNHPKVAKESIRVRLIALASYSLDIEIFAYVNVRDYASFLEIQEVLLLSCMEIVEGSGTGFAFPSSTLYLGRDNGLNESRTREVEKIIRRQRLGTG